MCYMNTLLAYTKSTSYKSNDFIELYTHYPSSIEWFNLYKIVNPHKNVMVTKSYDNITCTLNQMTSTPGLVWSQIAIPSKTKYLTLRYSIQSNLSVSPFIRDLSSNILYWVSDKKNLIDSGSDYITIKILEKSDVQYINIYMLAYNEITLNSAFEITNMSIDFFSEIPPLLNISVYSHKKIKLFSTQHKNVSNQKFISNSFAIGCHWQSPLRIQIPDNTLSGYYFMKLEYRNAFYWLCIIVKPDFEKLTNQLLVLGNSNKWNAYNTWGGLDGSMNVYSFSPTEYYFNNRNILFEGTDGTSKTAPRVSNYVHSERPNRTMSSYIQTYFTSNIKTNLFFNDHIYGEMFFPNYLDELNMSFDVISDRDMENLSITDLTNYKIFIAHVHPEYWSKEQMITLDKIHKAKIGIMYIGGNGLYWKCTWSNNQMEVRKDRKKHLDGSKGGQWKELGSPGEQIVKIYYSKMYPTNVQFGFTYQATMPIHPLLSGLVDSSGNIGFKNLNARSINYGPAGWEVDNVQTVENRKYLISKSPDNLCNMIWKDLDDTGPVFSTGSIIYTGSLFVDNNIYTLTQRVINKILNIQ